MECQSGPIGDHLENGPPSGDKLLLSFELKLIKNVQQKLKVKDGRPMTNFPKEQVGGRLIIEKVETTLIIFH